MSIIKKTARDGLWLAFLRSVAQGASWLTTIAVARLLSPDDYGLMAVAGFLTAYIEVVSELGLGAALVQRPQLSSEEISSNFWFSIAVGVVFAALAFGLAYPLAALFEEPRAVRLTQASSLIFVVGALMTVPFNLLLRNLRFKAIGICQLCGVIAATCTMLALATNGFGVWTLLGGTIVLRVVTLIAVLVASPWRPRLHFSWNEVKPFLPFGLSVAAGRSLYVVFRTMDVFLVGRVLGTQAVGYYSFAINLASLPSDKIVSLVNEVSVPLFSQLQGEPGALRNLYLKTTKLLAVLLTPMYLAGCVWGDDIVLTVLGDSWAPLVFMFRAMCLAQLVASLCAVNTSIHAALGHPRRALVLYAVATPLMAVAIYFSAQRGLDAVTVPWLTVYPLVLAGWAHVTIGVLGIRPGEYLRNVGGIVLALVAIIGATELFIRLLHALEVVDRSSPVALLVELSLMSAAYVAFLATREREMIAALWELRRA